MLRSIILVLLCFIITIRAQQVEQDSLEPPDPLAATCRSVLLPGWGQIYQERLLPGTIIYASSAYYYYQTIYRLHQYNKHEHEKFRKEFWRNLSFAVFFHISGIVDAAYTGYVKHPPGWQGHLLGDKPLKSPWGATLRSAILPGWGQVYNENYLKAVMYLAVDSYLFYKILEADRNLESTGIGKYRDRRSRYSWYFGLAYLLTMMDAHVGAYLFKFEKAMSLAVGPAVYRNQPGLCIRVAF